jgi:hypothetical protein
MPAIPHMRSHTRINEIAEYRKKGIMKIRRSDDSPVEYASLPLRGFNGARMGDDRRPQRAQKPFNSLSFDRAQDKKPQESLKSANTKEMKDTAVRIQ